MFKRRPKLLIVDDEEAMVFSMQDYLNSYADCLGATSYDEAVALLEKEKDIALVISDIRMPGRDGFDLLMWLRENYPKVKVIMMTAYGSPSVRALAKKKGSVMYIEKPLDLNQLKEIVKEILERKGFSATIKDMEFTDLLQFLSFAGKAVRVQVTNTLGEEGEIGLEGDDVLWVKTRTKVGEEAFFDIVSWEGGGFDLQPLSGEEMGRKEMGASLSYLLLEGTRRKDEDIHPETREDEEEEKEESEYDKKGEVRGSPLNAVLEEFKNEVPNFISAEVVSIDDGIPIVAISSDPKFDSSVAAAYFTEVLKANKKAIEALKKGREVEEMVVMTDDFFLIVRIFPYTRFFLSLAIGKEGNWGMARMIIKKYEDKFVGLLPAH
jgi:CheY-like chemotaxis protein/predicted regulator of Ras-like GTPase activity (Roadblock/LC7/MglB family)